MEYTNVKSECENRVYDVIRYESNYHKLTKQCIQNEYHDPHYLKGTRNDLRRHPRERIHDSLEHSYTHCGNKFLLSDLLCFCSLKLNHVIYWTKYPLPYVLRILQVTEEFLGHIEAWP